MARGHGKKIYRRGQVWWIRYWHGARQFRESSGRRERQVAEDLLTCRLNEVQHRPITPADEARVRVADLLDTLLLDYGNNRRRSLGIMPWRLKPLREAFARDRAIDVKGHRLERYTADRLAAGVAPATVNRELAALRRAFRLAVKHDRLTRDRIPEFTMLAEHNAREGFAEPHDFEAVARHLPDPLDDLSRFAYLSGWRNGEVKSLGWPDVDRSGRRVFLRREHSKNEEPRILPLTGQLAEIIERRWRAREYQTLGGGIALSPYVFHRHGRPVGDFRKAWRTACKRAGLAGLLFHDLRRSAVRNMDRAGVSRSVAMKITGHKTETVYRRYRIVDENDLREALEKTEAVNRQHPERAVTALNTAAGS